MAELKYDKKKAVIDIVIDVSSAEEENMAHRLAVNAADTLLKRHIDDSASGRGVRRHDSESVKDIFSLTDFCKANGSAGGNPYDSVFVGFTHFSSSNIQPLIFGNDDCTILEGDKNKYFISSNDEDYLLLAAKETERVYAREEGRKRLAEALIFSCQKLAAVEHYAHTALIAFSDAKDITEFDFEMYREAAADAEESGGAVITPCFSAVFAKSRHIAVITDMFRCEKKYKSVLKCREEAAPIPFFYDIDEFAKRGNIDRAKLFRERVIYEIKPFIEGEKSEIYNL